MRRLKLKTYDEFLAAHAPGDDPRQIGRSSEPSRGVAAQGRSRTTTLLFSTEEKMSKRVSSLQHKRIFGAWPGWCLPLVVILSSAVVTCRANNDPRPAGASKQASLKQAANWTADLKHLCASVSRDYVYLDSSVSDWNRACKAAKDRAESVVDRSAFVRLLEHLLVTLVDHHAHLNTNLSSSYRLVPSGADIWANWTEQGLVIEQVRQGYPAERAGIVAGANVLAIDGEPVKAALDKRLAKAFVKPTPETRTFMALRLLAGTRDSPRRLTVSPCRSGKACKLELGPPQAIRTSAGVTGTLASRTVEGRFGHVQVLNSLGDTALIRAFDRALVKLADTEGLIVDLRNTPSGGNTTVARGVMGRLVSVEKPYQKHVIPEPETDTKRVWLELVTPRGPSAYDKPIVVLVSRWTGSMGEGIAIGLDAMKRARVVGTRMAGLRGATSRIDLPHSRIGVYLPTERLLHIDGTPREDFSSSVAVTSSELAQFGADRILERGLQELKKQVGVHGSTAPPPPLGGP